MTTSDDLPDRNAALEFFGLPKDPDPDVSAAADAVAARVPDPVQVADANTPAGQPSAGATAAEFFGFSGQNDPLWTDISHRVNHIN